MDKKNIVDIDRSLRMMFDQGYRDGYRQALDTIKNQIDELPVNIVKRDFLEAHRGRRTYQIPFIEYHQVADIIEELKKSHD